ncbi:unnamed protein product [Boreogadus saida]
MGCRLQQSAEVLGLCSGTTSIGAPTRFRCRGALERRSGTPSSAALRRLALQWPRRWLGRGWVAPTVLDQPQLPTLLRLKVSPVVQPQRMGSLSREGCPSRIHGCTTATAAQLHRSPFCLVKSCIEGLGLGEVDMLPRPLWHQSPQEGVERQGLPCSRGEFRVAASGQELDISSVDPQALLLLAAVRSQQMPALVAEDPLTEQPVQCFGQCLKVSLVRLVQVEQHPCFRPLKGLHKVDDRLLGTPAVVPISKTEQSQVWLLCRCPGELRQPNHCSCHQGAVGSC